MDSGAFFGGPVVDPSVQGVGANVPLPKVVFAVWSIVGLSSMLPGAAEASPAEMSRATAGRTSGSATLFVRPLTPWFVGLVAVRRSAPGPDLMYQRNV